MKVPESVKEGWQGGGLGAGAAARARPGRHRRWPARSKQSNEVLHPDVRLLQNGPQCVPVQFSMCGDNGLRKWIVPPHNDMAAMLPAQSEAIRREWYVGGAEFKQRMLAMVEQPLRQGLRGSYSGEAKRAHGEAEAERLLARGLAALGLAEVQLAETRNGAWEKEVLAWWLRSEEHT